MERAGGAAGSSVGKEEALDVKPLRSLSPMFPPSFGYPSVSPPGAPPFVFISNFSPSVANGAAPPSADGAAPPSADGAAPPSADGAAPPSTDGHPIPPARRKPKRKRKNPSRDEPAALPSSSSPPSPGEDPGEAVEVVLMTFDALRRRILQLDEINNVTRRPDMKAGSAMADYDLRANKVKRIGPIPGVAVGDIFFFRMELLLVGLHSQSMAGIDSAVVRFGDAAEAVAVSVVSSGTGGYEDQTDAVDSLVYSGQGGANLDQKLERGNLALERSSRRGTAVRVIRGIKDPTSSSVSGSGAAAGSGSRIYLYDGLYRVSEYWVERGKSGFNVFKYRLLRQPDQPPAYATWKAAEAWKRDPAARPAVRLADLAAGAEPFPVCVVNEVDDEHRPAPFLYAAASSPPGPAGGAPGCGCEGGCVPGNEGCACARRNGGELPYSGGGVLVRRRAVVYECGGPCRCSGICRNRATQKGVKLRFEVFRTRGRGWGLRSWDPIRCGAFVCEFVGDTVGELCKEEEDDEYVFEGRCSEEGRRKWNYGPELLGEAAEEEAAAPQVVVALTARRRGNVARFMNHSCSPNVFWQAVARGGGGRPQVMFFAARHIPPMAELTYDYGMGGRKLKNCSCGSSKCRGFFNQA